MNITINSTGQTLTTQDGREAVELLASMGIIPNPKSDKYNPSMILQSPVRQGIISIEGINMPMVPNYNVPHQAPINFGGPILTASNNLPAQNNNLAETLANALSAYMPQQTAAINEGEVIRLIDERLSNQAPREMVIKTPSHTATVTGLQHPELETILTCLTVGLPVWLKGPAGSGKTTAAQICAKALNVEFYSISVCSQTTEAKLFGYMDATGNYIPTLFYKAYTEGGVFLIDEIDNGNPNVLAALNSALANGHCAFPNGMAERHKDFYCIAAANTIGTGANQKYVGRNPIDAATIDRFLMIDFYYFEDMEKQLCGNDTWFNTVISLRKEADKKGLNTIISPRASIRGAQLLEMGLSRDKVLEICIFNKCTETEKNILKAVL
jgi:hypothetical protein